MRKLLAIILFFSTVTNADNCADVCGNFDTCSFIGVIEIVEKSDDFIQAYKAKVLSVKYSLIGLHADGIGEDGSFINPTVNDRVPDEIIVAEYGLRPIDTSNQFQEYIVKSHGGSISYKIGSRYHYFGREIIDNVYESSVNSCTIKVN